MPPYLKNLGQECQRGWCVRKATVEVFNSRNASHGKYCRDHGNALLRRLRESESKTFASDRE